MKGSIRPFDHWLPTWGRSSLIHVWGRSLLGAIGSLVLWGTGLVLPGLAAERLTLKLGPLEQSVQINDLAKFAETGQIPSELSLYTPFLTPEIRQILSQRLQLEPHLGEMLLGDVPQNSWADKLLRSLQTLIPEVTQTQLRETLALAIQQANNVDMIGLLRAFPEEEIVIDLTQLAKFAGQFNALSEKRLH